MRTYRRLWTWTQTLSRRLFVWFPLGLLGVAGATLGLAQGTYGRVPVDLLVARQAGLWEVRREVRREVWPLIRGLILGRELSSPAKKRSGLKCDLSAPVQSGLGLGHSAVTRTRLSGVNYTTVYVRAKVWRHYSVLLKEKYDLTLKARFMKLPTCCAVYSICRAAQPLCP